MPQYHLDIATYYAEKHLTLAERNEAYSAAVNFANDRGVSHKNFLAAEYAGRLTMNGTYVPTKDDQVIPLHTDEQATIAARVEAHSIDGYEVECDGSYARTETGECQNCGEMFDVAPADPEAYEARLMALQD